MVIAIHRRDQKSFSLSKRLQIRLKGMCRHYYYAELLGPLSLVRCNRYLSCPTRVDYVADLNLKISILSSINLPKSTFT